MQALFYKRIVKCQIIKNTELNPGTTEKIYNTFFKMHIKTLHTSY
jgi:hypothetical protein